MRPRSILPIGLACLALGAAGCGGSSSSSDSGSSGSGSSGASTSGSSGSTSSSSSSAASGQASKGKAVFASAGCGSCHTLKDAGTTGSVGPNLDDLKPDAKTVERQVINGGGPMPAFKGQLSDAQIKDVSAYVSSVAGK